MSRQTLTTEQINNYQQRVESGGFPEVAKVYKELNDKGYKYAGWADGVAEENTRTGQAAVKYMQDSNCSKITQAQSDQIKKDMSAGYLDALEKKTLKNGTTDQDVNYTETAAFHEKAFKDNHLSLDNWTLKVPMDVMKDVGGEKAQEQAWERLRETGGTDGAGLEASLELAVALAAYTFKPSEDLALPVVQWLNRVSPIGLPQTCKGIGDGVAHKFKEAKDFIERRDPLTLDLDNDGIETVASSVGIMFDFDADGKKTGTGWIKADDGFVVLHLNGNHTIDSGRELFGIDTLKKDGTYALDGFDALHELDSNNDGVFDKQDELLSKVQIWQDLNQDGISQANELKY